MNTVKASDYLYAQEISELRKASDFRAVGMFVFNWLIILAAFLLVSWYPNPLTVIVAMLLLGGRLLGLGILLHECSHRSFFSTNTLNDFFGNWFAGIPILVPIDFYRPYHFTHHTKTGTSEDPDVGNIRQYPVQKKSFLRKVFRDFTGLSGVKSLMALLLYVLPGRAGNAVSLGVNGRLQTEGGCFRAFKNYGQVLIWHSGLFAVFYVSGHPLLYLLWWGAYLFTHPFIIRVRQIAEHGAMPALSSEDVRDTTRTTLAKPWERLLFAPNFVNYHCEHHLLPTVPSYSLPRMHAMMKSRGFYENHGEALETGGYPAVIRLAASAR